MKKVFFALLVLLICTAAGCQRQGDPSAAQEVPPTNYQLRSDELQKYTIVYEEENPDYFDLAYRLCDRIYAQYGILVTPVGDASTTPSQYEILLGDTNRYTQQGNVMEYSVIVDAGKCWIQAGGSFSAEKAIDFLCEQIFNGQEFALDCGTYYQTSFLTKFQPLTDGSSARIMSANVLADAFADASFQKAHYRAEIFAGMLISYTPDVIGLQEVDESWNQVLDTYLAKIQNTHAITYSRLLTTYEGKVNYTSLIYRSDKFNVEASDVTVFSWWENEAFNHNYHMRNISWAQLSSLDDPQKSFIVANTHWSYRTEHADGNKFLAGSDTPIAVNELRELCCSETDEFLSVLRQSHQEIPIFLTGDFNTSLPFFTESGWTPTSFRIISEEALRSGTAVSIVPSSGHYDHLFGCGDYAVDYFAFIKDVNEHSLLTDHPFVYADLTF